jgi:dipeptidyl aminopeptidase/acylaminoacyl peptidase
VTGGAPRRVDYGPAASQYLEVWAPGRDSGDPPWPTAVVLHGGYWRDRYDLHLMDGLCADLAASGWLAVNVEYRRVGNDGGGWPATFDDLRAALEAAARLPDADTEHLVAIGHSAGGHLALLAATVRPLAAVVALAPVSDLYEASARGLSDHAVHGLLGGSPAEEPARYEAADPVRHLPLGCPTLVVHGDADENVPIDLSEAFVAAARAAGDDVTWRELPGGDHFVVIDPSASVWREVVSWLALARR